MSTTYNVTNSGSGAYSINGVNNATITMTRGEEYIFDLNASGHPFWIQAIPGEYNERDIYSAGVTNNGAEVGQIVFQVPIDAPDSLYYICQYHISMQGTINFIDAHVLPPTPPVNYKLDAMLELRKFLWKELSEREIFDPTEYYSDNIGETIIPIIPVQQQPELNQFLSGKKHIIYDKVGMSYDDNWLICCEQILFTIYSTAVSDINEIRNFMTDQFRRMDESARDVNAWTSLSDKFKFHSIYLADISATAPSEELQGFFSSDVILEIKYSRMVNSLGRFI